MHKNDKVWRDYIPMAEMENINSEEIEETEEYIITDRVRGIWAAELNMLRIFIDICDRHGLTYYIWAGTLLGAVRHKGFIPWDDDIDVAMPRADYDKFMEIAQSELDKAEKGRYFLQNDHTDLGTFMGGKMRIRDNNTTGAEVLDLTRRSNWGIWIDILCLDYVFEDEARRREQIRLIARYKRLCKTQTYGETVLEFQQLTNKQKLIYHFYVKKQGRDGLLKGYRDACTMCPGEEGRLLFPFTNAFNPNFYRVYFAEDFKETVELEFEDLKVKAPIGYDRILQMYYGDYNELIPESQRKPKHLGVFDPEVPFCEYQHRMMDMFKGVEDKTLVLFGAGNMAGTYLGRHSNHRPAFLVDNGVKTWGRFVDGLLVCGPDKLLEIPKDKLRVIICNIYYPEIAKQLQEMGIDDYYLFAEDLSVVNQTLFAEERINAQIWSKSRNNQ
ncbi:LicD family protein [Butyrivibrio sp. WCD2001]|uniref:LicD family protein n=1 Tax=Butyrivibrio sp. WCD2001 TaxID=1280681 RepID=UPI0009DBBE60|nr:LicD family protein [Butyrivibrio sp. WCD2001]